ncbi:MAG: dienelactone hydrolase family protein [Candidatus Hydrogenedentes bacterium]|nr:dienelactone hydrolase family protein [Candidatus Hydrogenedentota bacterium]
MDCTDMDVAGIIEENVSFHAGEKQLEGVLAYPEDTSPEQAILLLSPHPHMGGRMDNNVLQHLARRFAEEGCATLRFNYGGVGNSTLPSVEGEALFEYWAKLEEEKNYERVLPDAIAARNYLADALPAGVRLGYVGYSFGCCLATLLAKDCPPSQLADISPPTKRAPLDGVEHLTMPSLFVVGDDDFAFDMGAFEEAFARVPGAKRFVQLDGCDHFFRKQEERVYETVRPLFFEA